MKLLRDTFGGMAFMTTLVGAAAWYAGQLGFTRELARSPGPNAARPAKGAIVSVWQCDWSADGTKLLSLARGDFGTDGPLLIHAVSQTSQRLPVEVPGAPIGVAALSPDGLAVLTGTSQGRLLWINLESMETTTLLEGLHRVSFTAAGISTNRHLVAAAADNSRIYLFDLAGGPSIVLPTRHEGTVSDLRFSTDGSRMVTVGTDGSIFVWDLKMGTPIQELSGHRGPATGAAFLPDGERIISAGLDDTVRVWSIARGNEEWRGEFGLSGVHSLALSPNGQTAAFGGRGGKIIVWDVERQQKKREIATAASIVFHLRFSPDGSFLASAGMEDVIRIYNPESGDEVRRIDVRPDRSL